MQPERIRVDSFFLANSAQVTGGKFYVLGGGWNFLNLSGPHDPVALISVVGRIVVPWKDADHEHSFEIHLEYGDAIERPLGGPRLRISLQPKDPPAPRDSVENATPFSFDVLGLTFPWAGEYAFVIRYLGEEMARTRFQVNFRDPSPN